MRRRQAATDTPLETDFAGLSRAARAVEVDSAGRPAEAIAEQRRAAKALTVAHLQTGSLYARREL